MSSSIVSQLKVKTKCSCKGSNLDKLVQPSILTLLATGEMHGYMIVQKIEEKDLFHGEKTDKVGIYRALNTLEEKGVITSEWNVEGPGNARKIYRINDSGKECLTNWIHTLENYTDTIHRLIEDAKAVCHEI